MNKKKCSAMFIILVILMLGIGYAYLNTSLTINGTSAISSSSWDIHFENISVKTGSITPTSAATISSNKLSVTYSVHLSIPGDYYEFTVDAKNSGTIDGMISSVVSKINGSTITTLPDYLEYYVRYTDDTEIENNHLLAAGKKETYKVHIGYKSEVTPSQLPSSGQNLNLETEILYTQSTTDAFPKPNYLYTVGGASFRIGTAPPSSSNIYNNFQDLIANNTSKHFLRQRLEDDIVVESFVGFIINGHDYYIEGGDGGESYSSNKTILASAFGSSNCTGGGTYYTCTLDGMSVRTESDGRATAYKNNFDCTIFSGGFSNCGLT